VLTVILDNSLSFYASEDEAPGRKPKHFTIDWHWLKGSPRKDPGNGPWTTR
jgi:hypothetical protein